MSIMVVYTGSTIRYFWNCAPGAPAHQSPGVAESVSARCERCVMNCQQQVHVRSYQVSVALDDMQTAGVPHLTCAADAAAHLDHVPQWRFQGTRRIPTARCIRCDAPAASPASTAQRRIAMASIGCREPEHRIKGVAVIGWLAANMTASDLDSVAVAGQGLACS